MKKETTIGEVNDNLVKTEYLVVDKKDGLAIVYDRVTMDDHGVQRVKRIYKLLENGAVEKVDTDAVLDEVIDLIKDKIELRDLLREVLRDTHPIEVMEALKRLRQPNLRAKVTPERRCYSLVIPGTKGQKPLELTMVR